MTTMTTEEQTTNDAATGQAAEPPVNPMMERIQQVRDLTSMTAMGAKSTWESMVGMAEAEAAANADAAYRKHKQRGIQ